MNNNEIEMPGSVKEYFSSNGIRATVDALLDQKLDDVFPGLDWNEIHDYHKALLAAATVRAEYAIFLLDVWDAVWGTAIKGTDYQSLPIDEIEKAFKPSAKGIWGDCLYRVHKKTIKSSPYLVTAVVYNGAEEGLTLFVALFQDVAGEKKHNKMASLLDTLNTLTGTKQVDWCSDEDDVFLKTVAKSFSQSDISGAIDVTHMRDAAKSTIELI